MTTSARLVAAVAGALIALTACGATAAGPTASSDPPLTLLPSADAFHSAIVATRALGTARVDVDVTSARMTPATRHGTGVSVLGSGMGDLTWDTPMPSVRELVNDRGIYVTSNGTEWTQWPVDEPTATSGYVDPLRGLGVLRDVTAVADVPLGAISTTTYTGWLPVDADEAAELGLGADAAGPDASLREQVTVSVDDFGHAVRVDRVVLDAAGSAILTSSTDLTEFSLQLDLSSPTDGVTLGARRLP